MNILQNHLNQISEYLNEIPSSAQNIIFEPDLKNDFIEQSPQFTHSRFFIKQTLSSEIKPDELKKKIIACVDCSYHQTRAKAAPGYGSNAPVLMFVGKAPKPEEDETGVPFSGEARDTIKAIVEKVLRLDMNSIYLTNAVKCRPDKSSISKKNIESCRKYLIEEINILKPAVICALGNEAAFALLSEQLKDESGITANHGNIYYYNETPVMLTFNPSSFLSHNDPEQKKKRMVFEDMKKLKILIDKITGRQL